MQYRQPIQVWRLTRTTPSARCMDAPVGHTSTHGGFSQCWHMTGSECVAPVFLSFRLTLRIHWGSVVGLSLPFQPFSVLQAATHSSQPASHLFESIKRPQRTYLDPLSPLAPASPSSAFFASAVSGARRMGLDDAPSFMASRTMTL